MDIFSTHIPDGVEYMYNIQIVNIRTICTALKAEN